MNKKCIYSIILSILFLILVISIKINLLIEFDSFIYNIITIKMNNTITNILKLFTFFGSTFFIVLLCIIFLLFFIIIKKKNNGIIITICLILSTILNNVVKIIIRRPRPEVLKLVIEKSFSFPSGHTMASVSMYGILIYLILKSNMNKKLKIIITIILSILPILVGISRIYLGAHYASDVIGGMILSTILLLLFTSIIDKRNLI